jgi:hypothetical protein
MSPLTRHRVSLTPRMLYVVVMFTPFTRTLFDGEYASPERSARHFPKKITDAPRNVAKIQHASSGRTIRTTREFKAAGTPRRLSSRYRAFDSSPITIAEPFVALVYGERRCQFSTSSRSSRPSVPRYWSSLNVVAKPKPSSKRIVHGGRGRKRNGNGMPASPKKA